MNKIIECVPNFSEGRDQKAIDAISKAIRDTPGCSLLDVDPGRSTNRTVYTFVGSPRAVIAGALNSAAVARTHIDMRTHSGEHPRMGALDVCPFIPVANVTMAECVDVSREFARRAAEKLAVPIYLYEEAAADDHRKTLTRIREGEYEGLADKLKKPEWKPDFGPAEFVPQWGATVTGARFFLIAYNVNILGTGNQAHRIALNLREAGRGKQEPGRLKEVKGMGWFVDEYNLAQVTVNLSNYKVTPIHLLFEEVKKEAADLNVGVAGSEIVGLVPLDAVLMAADYYIKKENLFILDEDQKIRLVIERLGLNSAAPFDPRKKIIDYLVEDKKDGPLAGMHLREFIEEIASRSSAPGGGSAAAAIAAIGAGLGSMVAKLTYGVRKFEKVDRQMRAIIPVLHDTAMQLIPMIDADTTAFNDYMEGVRMPHATAKEKQARFKKMQQGLKTAVKVPLQTMRFGNTAWDAMCDIARYGNPASRSDIEVGARSLETGIWGAYRNVVINLAGIEDEDFREKTLDDAKLLLKRAAEKCAETLAILDQK